MLERQEIKSIGISLALIILNIGMMYLFSFTALSNVNSIVFDFLIFGMIFYGIMISLGYYIGQRGIKNDNISFAIGGVALLLFAYSMFGAGIIGILEQGRFLVLGVTAGITLGITLIDSIAAYGTDHDFSRWTYYSLVFFVGGLVTGFTGSFSGLFALITFVLVLLGWLCDLMYQIWDMKQEPARTFLNGLGIYVAFMGVFVHILQIVAEMYLRE